MSSKVNPTPSAPPAERDLGINDDPLGVGAGVAAAAQPQPVTGSGATQDTTPGVSSAAERTAARQDFDGNFTDAMNPTQGEFSKPSSVDWSRQFSTGAADGSDRTDLRSDEEKKLAANSSTAGQSTLDASVTFEGLPYGNA